MTKKELGKDTKKTGVSRRNFLTAAAAVTAGAATLGFPSIAQGAGADHHALAEHLADQGHLPRVRP